MNLTTNFAAMNRDEIRTELTAAIGDSELPEDVREALVLTLEDLDNVTPDELWGHVEAAFSDYEDNMS